jgi:hypothetical protein
MIWPRHPIGGEGEDLDVNLIGAGFHKRIERWDDLASRRRDRTRLVGSDLAVEIPEIEAFGEGLPTLALQVFADVVFDRFKNARIVFAGHVERERFLHFA